MPQPGHGGTQGFRPHHLGIRSGGRSPVKLQTKASPASPGQVPKGQPPSASAAGAWPRVCRTERAKKYAYSYMFTLLCCPGRVSWTWGIVIGWPAVYCYRVLQDAAVVCFLHRGVLPCARTTMARPRQRRRQAADQDSPSKAGICRAGFGNRIAGFRYNRSDSGRCWNAIRR